MSVLETTLRGGPQDGQHIRVAGEVPAVVWMPKRPCMGRHVPISRLALPEFPACYERSEHCYKFVGWLK